MDRNIKFRGKSVSTGEWAYGWLCVWQGVTLIFDSPFNLFNNPIEVHLDTVGQFTGEICKSGEVYVGDRMVDEWENFGIVKFGKLPLGKSGDCVCGYPAFYIDCAGGSYMHDCCEIGDWMKVIGTIYDKDDNGNT